MLVNDFIRKEPEQPVFTLKNLFYGVCGVAFCYALLWSMILIDLVVNG